MSLLRIQPIVEGHGEVEAVRILLRRICHELCSFFEVEILHPLRQPRTRLVRPGELQRFAGIAANKLRVRYPSAHNLVLVLVDGDGDPPCRLGPELLNHTRAGCGDLAAACVVANLEYETWFVAAAASLTEYLQLRAGDLPLAPESLRLRKKWVEDRFRGPKYSETLDQPRLTAKMDLALCRSHSPSFDKLCREIERELTIARRVS